MHFTHQMASCGKEQRENTEAMPQDSKVKCLGWPSQSLDLCAKWTKNMTCSHQFYQEKLVKILANWCVEPIADEIQTIL